MSNSTESSSFKDRIRQLRYRERRSSLQGRLAAITALWVGLAVTVIGATAYLTTQNSLFTQLDEELASVATLISEPLQADIDGLGGLNSTALQAANVSLLLVQADGSLRRVAPASGAPVAGNQELAVARTQFGHSARTIQNPDGSRARQVAIPMRTTTSSWAIVLSRPLAPTLGTMQALRSVMLGLGSTFIVLGGLLGYLSGRSLMRPLREMTSAVAHVTETDELVPIGIHSDDELGQLSRNFDTMINSLASSRDRQRRLIADAGHELRTPLTSMRTNIELLVADEKSGMLPPGARSEILSDVAAQLGEFTSLVGDLVQLSREDVVTPSPEPLDFADVVAAAVRRAQRRGPGLTFDVALEPYFVVGEPDTLERAVTNLLDNAVKFSPEGGTIYVRLRGDTLMVTDEGPGIAEEDLPKLFDRFYRSNKARNTPGTGLGLSIVAHTAAAHGGSVKAANSRSTGGAEFRLTLPPAPQDAVDELLSE